MNTFTELDRAIEDVCRAVERIHGEKAGAIVRRKLQRVERIVDEKWPDGERDASWSGDAHPPQGTTNPLPTLPKLQGEILEYVKRNGGASLRQIRDGVRRRTEDVVQAVQRLETEGLIENRGTGYHGRYHPTAGNAGETVGNGLGAFAPLKGPTTPTNNATP